jgi:hypothetical protein
MLQKPIVSPAQPQRVETRLSPGGVLTTDFFIILLTDHCVYSGRHKKREGRKPSLFVNAGFGNYRLEYWNRFLAPFCPYFLRSFTLESRVSRPSFFSGARSGWLKLTSARAMAWRSAPA